LLAFAKAAYKNIQEKQQLETELSVAVEEDTISEEIVETQVGEITAPIEIDATIAEITEDVVNELQPEPELANLSFLERAAAERQAKQEKLIASAIETEIPEIQITTTAPEIEIPELVFDDGFKWSAKVLAAQGRKAEDISLEEITWLKKLRQGLDKTRRNILNQLKSIVGQGPLNQEAVNEIESLLLQADVGVEATDYIISALQKKLLAEVTPPEQAIAYLKEILRDILDAPLQNQDKPSFAPAKDTLTIWLITGVNGAGKTTTIGKISHLAQKSGYKCLIGAADTFRAAAVEQVKVWGERSGVEVIANPGKNTDPAAVVFDAIAAAQSRETELLLIDTAGRLQNKKNLMDELSKIRKIIDKKAPNARVESLLVLDSTLGQNGLRQAEVFSQAAQLSGVVLTKLDGTAKGGVALAVVQQLGLPIRFIGAGEGIEDLRPFSSHEFVEALLSD
jgi:fused signal recognition particle receptor